MRGKNNFDEKIRISFFLQFFPPNAIDHLARK